MRTLVVTEKPNVAERIANSLGKATRKTHGGVAYYEVGDTVVAPAVGHIYGLRERKSKGWVYPVFDIEWAPSYSINKSSAFTKKYLNNIKHLSKDCQRFINACDYDVEGEVIGYNVIKHACGADPLSEKVRRVKYSTLTKDSILKAFEKIGPIDKGLADAGLARHSLDWYWGINLSRALSNAARSAKRYATLSIGRVQGPTLKVLAKRERSIQAFKPETYWQVEMQCRKETDFTSMHEADKFSEQEKADAVKEKCGDKARVSDVQSRKYKQTPPYPFDLTTLQTEAYKHLNIDPRRTLEIAQSLYTNAYISYPRTSSQQIPEDIDCRKIITDLKRQGDYGVLCEKLLEKKKLKPTNGKKKDPAHPAIHPTGEMPARLDAQHKRVYDLVTRRFLASFGEHAVRQSVSVKLDNNGETFIAKGNTTVEKGWHTYYGPYAKFEENLLPVLEKGDDVDVRDVLVHEKETKPPKRFTPASIIKEMEKRNIGTKATRSQIVDILFRRGYLHGKTIEVTKLGLSVVDALNKYCPEVLSDKLTRKFEEDMEQIQEGKLTSEEVIDDGRRTLENILAEFKENELKIGTALADSILEAKRRASSLGPCPVCKNDLVVRKSRYGGHFIGCTGYPKCTHTWPLPKDPVKKIGECKHCGYAMMIVMPKGKRKWSFCVNQACPGKKKKTR
ncbi:MAG: DNA topoisomerase I [Candidatus Altiarchaeales archaeon]|nr:DNA topoisomerase I [Candidatus Altiarchaeales archaeon]MBD3417255.1 DNA topoisomerase I [Candidatus Altiarchaeales archaeon]